MAFTLPLLLGLLALGSGAPLARPGVDIISDIRKGLRVVVDTRDSLSRSVGGFLPGSLRAEEFSREEVPKVDISTAIFLVDKAEVEAEICTDGVTCYTGTLEPFADLLVFPEDVDFEALTTLLERKQVVLIDVRRPEELIKDGQIPGSVNLPLQDIPGALALSDKVFEDTYGFRKPRPEATNLVLTCRSGRRILVARERMEALGYTSLRLFRGSINGWKAKNGPLV